MTTHQWRVDGTERQIIKDLEGTAPRPKIKSCSICDPFVLIIREDDTIGLFIGELERGKIRRKDMSPMGDKVRIEPPSVASSWLTVSARHLAMLRAASSQTRAVSCRRS